MKLFSKIISAVAALSMVATMAVMPVAHAAGATLKLTATPAEDNSYVDLTVGYSGAEAKMPSSGIKVYIGEGFAPAECPEDYEGDYWGAMLDDEMEGWSTDRAKLDGVAFAVQATQIVFATTTTKTTVAATLPAECENLFTVRLFPTDKYDATKDYAFSFTGQNTLGANFKDYQGTLTLDTDDATLAATAVVPVPVTYAVTAGTGIASVDKTEAAEGDTVNFTVAEAPANKQLADIKVNGESIGKEATSFTMPAAAATVTAVFEDIMYTVTGANGITLDKSTAKFGDTVSITEKAIPIDKELVDIKVNDTSIGKDALSFLMPAENVTVTAVLQDKVVEPDPVVTFEGDRVTANNAVGFWSKLSAFENAGTVKAAGFVFANVEEVGKELETSQIQVADTLDLGQTITYEFKNLTGYDKFGLKGLAYIVTDKGTFWSNTYFGDGLLPIAR